MCPPNFPSRCAAPWAPPSPLPALGSYLNDNSLGGGVPPRWSAPGAFPALTLLRADGNALSGPLPRSLGSAGPGGPNMASLTVLQLFDNRLSGTLPEEWGRGGAFPRLQARARAAPLAALPACLAPTQHTAT